MQVHRVGFGATCLCLGGPAGAVRRTAPRQAKGLDQAVRVHQWAKNVLVFVPLLTARKFDLASPISAVGAFPAFSFAASADLVELTESIPPGRAGPLAAGTVPILTALPVAAALTVSAFGLASSIGLGFAGVLATCLALTTACAFSVKRKKLVDVIVFAALYTIRRRRDMFFWAPSSQPRCVRYKNRRR
jgi:4-hydroxybenzoate polyprenyltransferase